MRFVSALAGAQPLQLCCSVQGHQNATVKVVIVSDPPEARLTFEMVQSLDRLPRAFQQIAVLAATPHRDRVRFHHDTPHVHGLPHADM
jgi:hypothetical protein